MVVARGRRGATKPRAASIGSHCSLRAAWPYDTQRRSQPRAAVKQWFHARHLTGTRASTIFWKAAVRPASPKLMWIHFATLRHSTRSAEPGLTSASTKFVLRGPGEKRDVGPRVGWRSCIAATIDDIAMVTKHHARGTLSCQLSAQRYTTANVSCVAAPAPDIATIPKGPHRHRRSPHEPHTP